MRPVVRLRGLTCGYDSVAVVHGLDLSVNEGEIVALVGANGAGKTTTLLAISGFIRPLAGEISVLGEHVGRIAPQRLARAGVAHVPEDRSLFFGLTTRENLRLAMTGNRRDRRAALAEALELFPALGPLLDRRAGLLSGGEQQMLATARGLVARPKVLLIDEMSLGLAPVIVQGMLPVIRRAAEAHGCGVLLVEQHVQMALGVADRAYVMSHGRVTSSGPAAALLEQRGVLEASYLGDVPMAPREYPDP